MLLFPCVTSLLIFGASSNLTIGLLSYKFYLDGRPSGRPFSFMFANYWEEKLYELFIFER